MSRKLVVCVSDSNKPDKDTRTLHANLIVMYGELSQGKPSSVTGEAIM